MFIESIVRRSVLGAVAALAVVAGWGPPGALAQQVIKIAAGAPLTGAARQAGPGGGQRRQARRRGVEREGRRARQEDRGAGGRRPGQPAGRRGRRREGGGRSGGAWAPSGASPACTCIPVSEILERVNIVDDHAGLQQSRRSPIAGSRPSTACARATISRARPASSSPSTSSRRRRSRSSTTAPPARAAPPTRPRSRPRRWARRRCAS